MISIHMKNILFCFNLCVGGSCCTMQSTKVKVSQCVHSNPVEAVHYSSLLPLSLLVFRFPSDRLLKVLPFINLDNCVLPKECKRKNAVSPMKVLPSLPTNSGSGGDGLS